MGSAISGVLVLLAIFWAGALVIERTAGSPLQRGERGLMVFVAYAAVLVVALLPALACGWLASRWPKTLRLDCRGCSWSGVYELRAGRARALRPDVDE
jgi:hypothetical protein